MDRNELNARVKAMAAAGAVELNISRRNKKLVPNADTNFIIWNIPARVTCPHATAMCKKYCYAVKAETAYKDCLPSRRRNLEETKADTFVRDMTYTILKVAAGSRKKNLIVRIHESGDFYNPAYTGKWLEIMRNCADVPGIKFIAYTKSFPFFDGVKLPDVFALRASIWADTPAAFLEMIARNGWNTYSAVEKFTDADTFHQCRCEDCATCGKCWDNGTHEINCEIH